MRNTKLRRRVMIETSKDEGDMAFDAKMALINWKKFSYKLNNNRLKETLGINDIVNVDIEIVDTVDRCDSSLRLYIYKTKKCDVYGIKDKKFSYALQVSLGNKEERSNWTKAEDGFSAKVFPRSNKELIMLIEDIVLDTQMFYYNGYENYYNNTMLKKDFSKMKVEFLRKESLNSYLGNVDSAEYVSIAAFCRDKNGITDFNRYVKMWDKFRKYVEEQKSGEISNERYVVNMFNINNINSLHPKGRQISTNKIKKLLNRMPSGKYILLRTEKKPRKCKQCRAILSVFGLSKWKTGKIKIVPFKYRFTYQRMCPYISLFEFEWEVE